MRITKDFEGLEKKGSMYFYDGDIISSEELIIDIPLFCTGSIASGKWIKAGEWIEAGKWIEAGEWIKAGGIIVADSIKMCGIKTQTLKVIFGLQYKIWVTDTHIKIGCQLHSKKEWSEFTDDEISEMDERSSLTFWNDNKGWILCL